MDTTRAAKMAGELKGHQISGWTVGKQLGSGKSALVFEAEKDGQRAALKVFDPELIERFGKEKQLARIARECELIGKKHPYLVEIFDGGECEVSSHLFIAMELLDAPSLQSSIQKVPRDAIGRIIGQVAEAARFLESNGLVHRDIKPDNIAITADFGRAVLLDLGVLRPFADSDLTDEDAHVFIGTLRYASPEFLIRREEKTEEGYRAITFYQLGAVLHDLIMRKRLFEEFSDPYMVLGEAVRSETPTIHANDVSANLVDLARNCLVKEWKVRLALVKWNDFQGTPSRPALESAKERVKLRSLAARSARKDTAIPPTPELLRRTRQEILDRVDGIIRQVCSGNEGFPRMKILRDVDHQETLSVTYDESPVHTLSLAMCVAIRIQLIDPVTRSIRVYASACLLKGIDCEPDSHDETTIFLGPFDSEALDEQLESVLYVALDEAQRTAAKEPMKLDLDMLAVGEE